MKEKTYISIDLKSFFASCECVNRGLNPFTTPLVVADTSRGNGAMCLAVSPYLRNKGVPSRTRVYTLPKNIKIIYAKPRMKLYDYYSHMVLNVYKEFFSDEDIHVYSIDEVFIDATDYLKYYKMNDIDLATMIMKTIKDKTGITSTSGIGPNIFLAKVAMDIEAKHNKNNIAKWTNEDIHTKLQNIEPISKIWGFGLRTEKKLNNLGIKKLSDINNYPKEYYIKRFGTVMGNDIYNKANGIFETTIKDFNRESKEKSISLSQILNKDYNINDAFLIIKEMNDMLNTKLRHMKLQTKLIYVAVTYSKELCHGFHETILLSDETDNKEKIFDTIKYIYYKNIEDLPIRKVAVAYLKLSKKTSAQLSLFDKDDDDTNEYYNLIDEINERFGKTSLLRASSLLKNSTIKNREKFKNMI